MSTDSIESAGNGIFLGSGFCICASLLSTYTPTRVVTDARAIRIITGTGTRKIRNDWLRCRAPSPSNHFASFGLSAGGTSSTSRGSNRKITQKLVLRAYRGFANRLATGYCGRNPYQPVYFARLESLADKRCHFHGPLRGCILEFTEESGVFVFQVRLEGFIPHW